VSLLHTTSLISLLIFFLLIPPPPCSTLFPYTTLFRSFPQLRSDLRSYALYLINTEIREEEPILQRRDNCRVNRASEFIEAGQNRSEEHTSELQSLRHLVCRLLLEKKKNKIIQSN